MSDYQFSQLQTIEQSAAILNPGGTLAKFILPPGSHMRVQLRLAVNWIALGLLNSLAVGPSLAQSQLPPPPNVPVFPPSSTPARTAPPRTAPSPLLPHAAPAPNERVFTAPGVNSSANPIMNPIMNSGQVANRQFRVWIDNDSPSVLQQARAIEPDAFFQSVKGRRVIQAGLFRDPLKAQQQIAKLAARGIQARIANRSPQSNFEPSKAPRGYYAIVPGNRNQQLREYRDRAIRLGIAPSLLQLRDQPRGLHLAVGPFANQRTAAQLVQSLRDRGGLDARLFYDR